MGKAVEYIERTTGERVTESVMGDGALRFAYETLAGRTLWPVLFGSKFVSALMGRYYDSPRSKKAIASLVNIPGCRADEAEKPPEAYGSFNEFFTRRLKPGARPMGEGFVSPADGRLRLYLDADASTPFPLKGAVKSLREVFQPSTFDLRPSTFNPQPPTSDLRPPTSLDIAVIRLAPVDYHHFHFPCDCRVVGGTEVIPGSYHSVNPVALLKYPDVYADNERQIVEAESEKYGKFRMVDVGAFGVGTIVQSPKSGVDRRKGEERGYFKFGGSTVILVMNAGAVRWDEDLVHNSAAGLETRVFCLERLGL